MNTPQALLEKFQFEKFEVNDLKMSINALASVSCVCLTFSRFFHSLSLCYMVLYNQANMKRIYGN